MKTNHIKLDINNNIATLTFDMKDSNANTLGSEVLEEFDKKLDELKQQSGIQALLIQSAKPSIFIAGANIKEIEPMNDEKVIFDYLMRVNEIFLKLERLKFPSIAYINGSCMGGGLELALACSYRIATSEEATKIAFPEVKLGFFPGFGGTQRLPKLIGLIPSLDLILTGKTIDAKKAYKLGLVNEFFAQGQSKDRVEAFIQKAIKKKVKNKKRFNLMEYFKVTQEYIYNKAFENLEKKVHPKYFGPYRALDVIRHTYKSRHHIGIKVEAQTFSEVAVTKESKHLINLFFTQQALKKEYKTEHELPAIEQTAVVGSGVMGKGIIWLFSKFAKGVRIKLRRLDQTQEILQGVSNLYDYFIKTHKMTKKQVDFKLNRLSYTQEYKGFKLIDFALEAIIENKEEKIKTYKELEKELNEQAILATNTSSISIETLSAKVKNKKNFLGVHFFNPVNKMPLVEVIPNSKTSQESIERVFAFLKQCGKTPVLVHDCAGFLVNRVLLPFINEAGFMLQEGNGIEKIDKTLKEFGLPMGAFELADTVGIDVGYKVATILEESYGSRMKVCELLTEIYNKKLLGKKTGIGFYIHTKESMRVNHTLENTQKSIKVVTSSDMIDRAILIMVNEASRCLEEGIIDNVAYLDYAMIAGTGFPAFRGGLLKYADELGIDYIVSKLLEFEKRHGERFRPSQLLLDLQKNKKTFYTGEALWKH
ncbi:3-hydroxyacyl-CoA dehydrogenase NAD-binding domain-containing protein [Candidatus Marinarcus aquaticus]|uniref:enoyl-CoA hydratase n=1 Tax=Candidatus Marinarcus aquaticus TaxID=2044504 RepID=A0A4Q0XV21_9BACT|nr:3-hydroxyacyl-CoA dehydrogenase NAD-binding domain-containing protein [Candidatus Marinarcus aquaticus]RXJ60825.1 enoyl-CoA hydratase [Candidatus Marinarcus aquaticus]